MLTRPTHALIALVLALAFACSPTGEDDDASAATTPPDVDPADQDGDGFTTDDCDDHNAMVHPGAAEDGGTGSTSGDGLDNDCDGTVDEGTRDFDDDGDGWTEVQGDCADDDPVRYPGPASANPCPRIINLSQADVTWTGEGPSWGTGYALSCANASGEERSPTLLIGTDGLEEATSRGRAYLLTASVLEDGLLSSAEAIFTGEELGDQAGSRVKMAGDVNRDGVVDLLIGAPQNSVVDKQAGKAYLFYGPVSGEYDLGRADAIFLGDSYCSFLGAGLSSAGDFDGDGFEDVLIGASMIDDKDPQPGRADVFFGPVQGSLDPGDAGLALYGEEPLDRAGASVALAGDVNGDGHPDLLVGAHAHPGNGPYSGKAYLVYGPARGDMELAQADASFLAEAAEDHAGIRVAGAGDVNRDGYDDVLIGAHFNADGGTQAGKAYLFYGPLQGDYPLADADAWFIGEHEQAWAGIGLSSAGDFNGDGFDDILVAAPGNVYYGPPTGRTYLFAGPLQGELTFDHALLVLEDEAAGDRAGVAVTACDLNADGFSDLVVGAPYNDENGLSAGKVYIVYGRRGP